MSLTKNLKNISSHNRKLYVFIFILSTIIIFLPLLIPFKLRDFMVLRIFGVFIVNLIGSATIFFPNLSILSVGIEGSHYSPMVVALAASLGSSLGESVGFMFGYSSKEMLELQKKHSIIYKVNNLLFSNLGPLVIFLFSLIPNPIFDGIGILVGMSSFSLKNFLIIVFAGRFLRNLIIASIGARF